MNAGQPFDTGKFHLARVISISHNGAVLAHVNCAFDETEAAKLAKKFAAAPEMFDVLRDVAALLPAAGRMHPDDILRLQTRVCAALAKAGAT
jgi:hypothetical protein